MSLPEVLHMATPSQESSLFMHPKREAMNLTWLTMTIETLYSPAVAPWKSHSFPCDTARRQLSAGRGTRSPLFEPDPGWHSGPTV